MSDKDQEATPCGIHAGRTGDADLVERPRAFRRRKKGALADRAWRAGRSLPGLADGPGTVAARVFARMGWKRRNGASMLGSNSGSADCCRFFLSRSRDGGQIP